MKSKKFALKLVALCFVFLFAFAGPTSVMAAAKAPATYTVTLCVNGKVQEKWEVPAGRGFMIPPPIDSKYNLNVQSSADGKTYVAGTIIVPTSDVTFNANQKLGLRANKIVYAATVLSLVTANVVYNNLTGCDRTYFA